MFLWATKMGNCLGLYFRRARGASELNYVAAPATCRLCRTNAPAELATVIICKCGRAVLVHPRCRRAAATRNECWCGLHRVS